MLTIRAEINKSRLKSDETYNVKIRLTYNRQVRRISTSLFVTPKDLTKSLKFKEDTTIKKDIDNLVHSYKEKCNKLQLELNYYTLDDIVDYLHGEHEKTKEIDFIKFSHEWIEEATIKGKANYTTALNALISYLGKEQLPINQINRKLLTGFSEYINKKRNQRVRELLEQGKRVPSNRALSLYLGSIRHLYNEARKKYNDYDRNIILIPNSPFEHFQIPKQEATRKRALSADLIKKIWELPYQYTSKGKELENRYNLAKDCFILSFCLMGINSVDLYNCTERTEESIIYYRTKTKDRRHDNAKMIVDIPKAISPLIKKYKDPTGNRLFNFYHSYSTEKHFNKAINKGLKKIGEILKVDDLEFYAARHSWATIALNKVGIDKYSIHSALNHLDESMKVTDIYIERDFRVENIANEKVIKHVFS